MIQSNTSADGTYEEAVRDHYNNIAENYSSLWEGISPAARFFNHRKRLVLELLRDCPRDHLLEIGCGPGMMIPPLLEQGFNYVGADISENMISVCRRKFGETNGTEFAVANINSLPFLDQSYPVVLCLGALEYLRDHEQAFLEVARVLEYGGAYIFSMLNRRCPYRFAERLFRSRTLPCRHFTEGDAKRLMSKCGFRIIDCIYFDFNLIPSPIDTKLPSVASWIDTAVDICCPRRVKRWLGTGFLIKSARINL